MVLDLMLRGEDGLSICRRLRSQSNPMPRHYEMRRRVKKLTVCRAGNRRR